MAEYPFPGFDEWFIVGRHADSFQRCVALDGTVDVATRCFVVALPGAVRALCIENRIDQILLARMLMTEKVHRQKPFSLHARVRLEHPYPEALGILILIQPARRPRNRIVELRLGLDGMGSDYGHKS